MAETPQHIILYKGNKRGLRKHFIEIGLDICLSNGLTAEWADQPNLLTLVSTGSHVGFPAVQAPLLPDLLRGPTQTYPCSVWPSNTSGFQSSFLGTDIWSSLPSINPSDTKAMLCTQLWFKKKKKISLTTQSAVIILSAVPIIKKKKKKAICHWSFHFEKSCHAALISTYSK